MKNFFYMLLYLFLMSSIFSQEVLDRRVVFDDIDFDPFFAATILDNEGETFNISRLAFYDEYNEKKFFFWVRRNSGLYSLNFKNIKRITFQEDDFSDSRYEGFTRGDLELITGEVYTIYLKTTGHLEGFDEAFDSPVTFYLHYNLITSIEFRHTGEYKLCPFCGNIYFDTELGNCIYDKTPLIQGVIENSNK